jgi:hypothetical protein
LLDDRVSPASDLEYLTAVDNGTRVALGARQLGETGRGVELGERGSDAAEPAVLALDGRCQLREDVLLQAQGAFRGGSDAPLDVDQLNGRETHGIGHRLSVTELVRERRFQQRLGVTLRHLDEEAEDVVVADLQRFYAGALDVLRLQPGHHAAPVFLQAAGLVELRPIALTHEAAVALEVRRIVDERRRQRRA